MIKEIKMKSSSTPQDRQNTADRTGHASKRYCPPFQPLGVQFGGRPTRTLPKAILKQ